MTHRHALEQHIHSLEDIRKIIHSMKSLAYIETRKLGRLLNHQQQLARVVERAAADFLAFHPHCLPPPAPRSAYLLIGSERGFCGDFNEQLLHFLRIRIKDAGEPDPFIIGVGQRLSMRIEGDVHLVASVGGADVAEEVDRVLVEILEAVYGLRERQGPLSLTAVLHCDDPVAVAEVALLPPFHDSPGPSPPSRMPPLLNLEAADFLLGLVEHYLFAALHEILFASLLAENRRRVQQLEGAGHHLDEQLEALSRRSRQLRQEEIIEEIEVILLGSAGV